MGFYGSVIYEFTKMFSKLNLTKSSSNSVPMTPGAGQVSFEAGGMWEELNLEPANRWIAMDGTQGNATDKIIKIGHSIPGDKTIEIASTSYVDEATAATLVPAPVQLKNGDVLKVATQCYDAAGHLAQSKDGAINPYYSYFKLPVATINIGKDDDDEDIDIEPTQGSTNDKLSFSGDGHWITLSKDSDGLKISHTIQVDAASSEQSSFEGLVPESRVTMDIEGFKTSMKEDDNKSDEQIQEMEAVLASLPSDTIITPLDSGDLVRSYNFIEDAQGHVIGVEPLYFKLPVSATDVAFDSQKNDIAALQHRLNNDSTTPNKITLLNGTEYQYPAYESILPIIYQLGNQNAMYSSLSNYKTITETIGKIDGNEDSVMSALRNLLGEKIVGLNDCYTLSEVLQVIMDFIGKQEDAIQTAQSAVRGMETRVLALEGRVTTLEKKVQ